MTREDVKTGKLMEIAAVVTTSEGDGPLSIIAKTESIVIHCDDATLYNMSEWCKELFINDVVARNNQWSLKKIIKATIVKCCHKFWTINDRPKYNDRMIEQPRGVMCQRPQNG